MTVFIDERSIDARILPTTWEELKRRFWVKQVAGSRCYWTLSGPGWIAALRTLGARNQEADRVGAGGRTGGAAEGLGHPLIFGRGGEEALALAAAGVPFRIVPGVSAGIGGTASAGIPLTHRTLARSVVFATGHDAQGGLPGDLDLAALARTDVVVFYMALRQTDTIATKLIAAGRALDEAIAFVSDATSGAAMRHRGNTGHRWGGRCPTRSPRIRTPIVIGPVLALRDMIAPLQQSAPMTLEPARCAIAGAHP